LVLQRDLSVWLRDVKEPTATTLVLDAAGGCSPAINGGATVHDSLRATLLLAVKGAGGVKGQIPDRIQAPTAIADALRSVLGQLQREAGFPSKCIVEEIRTAEYAEWVFDGFIAQLAGRQQPVEPLQPEDARFLYEQARRFMEAKPWTKLTPDEELLVELKLASQRMEGILTVAGHQTAQPGLLLIPGREPASALMASYCELPIGTIFAMLQGAEGPPDLFFRARRYGWPADAVLTPTFLTVHEQTFLELDRRESYPMALAFAAVVAYVGGGNAAETWGGLDLPNGRRGRYHLRKAPEAKDTALRGTEFVGFTLSDDLMPPDSDVQIGILSPEHLDELRRHADVVVPQGAPLPVGANPIPMIVMTPSNRDFAGVVDRIKRAKPLGVTAIEGARNPMLTILCRGTGFVIATDRPSAKVWKRNIQGSDGAHVLIVTDTVVNKEAPDPDRPGAGEVGRVYGLFECMLRGGSIEAIER
jgi:hypothetical protein